MYGHWLSKPDMILEARHKKAVIQIETAVFLSCGSNKLWCVRPLLCMPVCCYVPTTTTTIFMKRILLPRTTTLALLYAEQNRFPNEFFTVAVYAPRNLLVPQHYYTFHHLLLEQM